MTEDAHAHFKSFKNICGMFTATWFQEECKGEITPVETGLTMETTSFQGGSPVPSNPSPHAHSLRQDYERWKIS
jgi:hypothetical protein